MALGKLDSHMQKMKLDHYLTPFTKINSKWIMDPNIKSKITTFLEDNIQENPDDLILSMEMTF